MEQRAPRGRGRCWAAASFMRVQRRIEWTSLAVVAIMAGLLAPPAAAGSAPCPPRHARRIVGNHEALIYEGENREGEDEVFGCAKGAARPYRLGRRIEAGSQGGGGISGELLVGAVMAYEESEWTEGPAGRSKYVLIVRNLRDGRMLHKVPTGPSTEAGVVGKGPATAMVLKRDGAIAWINGAESLPLHEVIAVDRTGSRTLATGTGINTHSLRLRANVLTWRQNGRQRTATLN